jgi:hypothetical protein
LHHAPQLAISNTRSPIWNILCINQCEFLLQKDVPNCGLAMANC